MRAPRGCIGNSPFVAIALAVLLWGAGPGRAEMMLTPAGAAAGFRLSTFATGFPTVGSIGPLGIAFPASGGVLVTDFTGNARLFPTQSDGQSAASAPVTQNYGFANAAGLAQVGGSFYMAQAINGAVVQVNPNGTFNRFVAGGMTEATALAVNPANGHLFVGTTLAAGSPGIIFDVNPITGTSTPFVNVEADGLAVTPDGKTLFGATDGGVLGFDTATGALVWDSGPIAGITDGVALGMGTLGGKLFVNTNAGQVIEVDLATLEQTVIATGGSRGDFVVPAPDGSLLLTQTDSILRLSAPPGGSFGPNAPDAPVDMPGPSSLAVLGLGSVGLLVWRRVRRSR